MSGEWAKHLRPWFKKRFWKKHRQAEKKLINEETTTRHPEL